MYKTFEYAVGASWVIGMYGTRAIYTVKKIPLSGAKGGDKALCVI